MDTKSLRETKRGRFDYYYILALIVLLIVYLLKLFTQNPILEYYTILIDLIGLIVMIGGFVLWVRRQEQ
jgi:uncharacterized membrane protein YhaH (DUF805 family)